MQIKLILDVQYESTAKVTAVVCENLSRAVLSDQFSDSLTVGTDAKVTGVFAHVRPWNAILEDSILVGAGAGFCPVWLTPTGRVCAIVSRPDGRPIVFNTREEAEKVLVEYWQDRLEQCIRGDLSFDSATIFEEFVQAVTVGEDGLVFDEDEQQIFFPLAKQEQE